MISVGIDIGSYSVKVAKVEGSSKDFRIVAIEEHPLPLDPTKDTTLDIIEILRGIVERHANDGAVTVIAARQSQASVRHKVFPFRERHKIVRSLPFEMEDDIPLDIEQAIIDAKVTYYVGTQTHVLAVATPISHIERILKRCEDSGLDPDILSLESFALSNLFEGWKEAPVELNHDENIDPAKAEPKSARVHLHLGHTNTIGLIIEGEKLLNVFSLDWGGKDIAEQLAQKYDLQFVEAMKELRSKGFVLTTNDGASRDQVAFSDVIKAAIEPMTIRVRLALAEAEANHHLQVEEVLLSGGVSLLRNLSPYLTQKFERLCNRLQALPEHPEYDIVANAHNEMSQLVAVGLAAEGLKRPKNPALNLLRGEFAKGGAGFVQNFEKWKPIVYPLMALFIIASIWASLRVDFADNLYNQADSTVKKMGKESAGLTGLRVQIRDIRAYVNQQKAKLMQQEVMESLEGIESSLDMLKNISALAPAKSIGRMNVTELSIRTNKVSIQGYSDKNELIERFRKALAPLASKGEVRFQQVNSLNKNEYKGFALSFDVEPKTAEGSF